MKYPEIQGYGERLAYAFDVRTNNSSFFKFMLENNVVLYKTVSYPFDLSKNLEVMRIQYYAGNEREFTTLSLDHYSKLIEIEIGFRAFSFVTTVAITDNPKLKSIQIGKHCFDGVDNGSFFIKRCDQLELIEIGSSVATKYTVFEIEGRINQR